MDMMNSIAATAMSMSAAQLSQQYSISVMKKSMEGEQQAAQQLLDMLPQDPTGYQIDVYA